jgi:hypothetical protein
MSNSKLQTKAVAKFTTPSQRELKKLLSIGAKCLNKARKSSQHMLRISDKDLKLRLR